MGYPDQPAVAHTEGKSLKGTREECPPSFCAFCAFLQPIRLELKCSTWKNFAALPAPFGHNPAHVVQSLSVLRPHPGAAVGIARRTPFDAVRAGLGLPPAPPARRPRSRPRPVRGGKG